MKATTEYWMGTNHVGDKVSPMNVTHGPVSELIKRAAKEILENPLHKRFELVIARTEEECRARLEQRSNVGVGSRSAKANDSMLAELDAMLAEIGDD